MRKAHDLPHRKRAERDKEQKQRRGNRRRQREAECRRQIRRSEHHARKHPQVRPQFILVVDVAAFLIAAQLQRRNRQLRARDAERQQQAEPKRHAAHEAENHRERQKADDDLQHRVAVIDERVHPRVHAHEDHRVILIARRVEKARVHIGADGGQEQKDVQKRAARRGLLVQQAGAEHHRQKIDQLAKEHRAHLPQHGEDIREDLEIPHAVQLFRQRAADERKLLDRVQNAVDAVCIPQRKRKHQCFTHRLPP